MEIKSSKDCHQTEQREKEEEAMHTHIEDIQRLFGWLHERLKCSKPYCIR